MKLDELIKTCKVIQQKFGNLKIVGGYLTDDSGLDDIIVVNNDGCEIYPENLNGDKIVASDIEGVFLT